VQLFVLAGFGFGKALSGSVRLGQIEVDMPNGQFLQKGTFLAGEAGDAVLTPYGVGLGVTTDITLADGRYQIDADAPGLYQFEASRTPTSTEATGSVISSADALAALKLAVGINPNAGGATVSPYQFLSADVTGDSKVTSADALAILKMAVRRIDAPAREWLFVNEGQDFWNETASSGKGAYTTSRTSVPKAGVLPTDIGWTGDQDVNLVALFKGDVNGSWTAPTGSQVLPDTYFSNLVAANPLTMNITQFGIASTPVI
jgi:hypothetical protein